MDSIEIIEKIRTEIKIRLSANGAFDEEGDSAWHYDQGLNDAYNYILSFLSDIEKEEKPNSTNWEQIEKRAKESEKALDYMREHPLTHEQAVEQAQRLKEEEKPTTAEGLEEEIERWNVDNVDDNGFYDTVAFARHFYEFGKQSKPVLSDDLEKAAREYAMDDFYNGYSSGSIIEDTMKNFKAGAEWGRRNLLQEIADGKTHPVDGITAAWLDNTEE